METAEGEESEDGASSASSVLGKSTHDQFSPDGLKCFENQSWNNFSLNATPESTKFRKKINIPFEFLELVQLAKRRKRFSLAARDVAGRQCIPVVLKDSRSCC